MTANFPDKPTATLGFGVYTEEDSIDDFIPRYYPERFNVKTGKELERTASDCAGQRVSIDELKNSEIHITGKAVADKLNALDEVAHTTEPVEVISPVFVTGGMEAYVKSSERGEIDKYDRFVDGWLVNYTIDLVSTGKDEYESGLEVRYGKSLNEDQLAAENSADTSNMPYVDGDTLKDLQDPEEGEYGAVAGTDNEPYLQVNDTVPDVLKKPDALNVSEFTTLRDNGYRNEDLQEDADLFKGEDALTIEEYLIYKERQENLDL